MISEPGMIWHYKYADMIQVALRNQKIMSSKERNGVHSKISMQLSPLFFSNIGHFIFPLGLSVKNTTGPPWYFTPPVTDGLRCRWMLAAAGGGNFSSQDMVNEGMMTPPNPTSKDELGKHIWQKFCFLEISSFNFFLEWFGWDSGVRCFWNGF